MKIVLSGGGTLGPVVPLLAVREACLARHPDAEFIWVGTKHGPEKELVEKSGLSFFTIGAGKWRRYFSFLNIFDLFKIIIAFWQSLFFLWQEKPGLIISCGGFVSVPLHWAAAVLNIPAWVHQQDVRVGLANKLMFPFAKKITTALQETIKFLPREKTEWLGNPSRDLTVKSPAGSRKKFNIPAGVPVIFALGGGTGSASINKLVLEAIPHWPKDWQVIHLVGRERPREVAEKATGIFKNYHVYPFFTDEIKDAYAIADVVIARAGFSTLSELAALKKAAVILPMFGTHQEDNARLFLEQEGVVMMERGTESGIKLAQIVKELVLSPADREHLGKRLQTLLPRAKPEKIVEIIDSLL